MGLRVLLAVLTHHDLPRLQRALRSARSQLPAPGLVVEPLVVVNSQSREFERNAVRLAGRFRMPVEVTKSIGTAAGGKNACLDLFLKSDCDYLCQVDGDDWLYPTCAQSIAEHLRRLPAVDAIGLVPIDCLGTRPEGYSWQLTPGVFGAVWGTSTAHPGGGCGPGTGALWQGEGTTACTEMLRLLSRGAAARWRFREELLVSEDTAMSLCLLKSHQRGELSFWRSMASDWMIVDRTTPGSVQTIYRHKEDIPRLRTAVDAVVERHRSSTAELPMLYPPLLLDTVDKRSWIERTWRSEAAASGLRGLTDS